MGVYMITDEKQKEIKDLVELVYDAAATKDQITAKATALLSDDESREYFLTALQDKLNVVKTGGSIFDRAIYCLNLKSCRSGQFL